MAISVVGTDIGSAGNGNDVTLTLPGGIAEDDEVVAFVGHLDLNGTPTMGSSGYTTLQVYDTGSADPALGAFRKRMGSTPDTNVTLQGSGSGLQALCGGFIVLRGVDPGSFLDVTIQIAGPSVGVVDPAAVTTTTNGVLVIVVVCDAGSDAADEATAAPSGYTDFESVGQPESHDAGLWFASKLVASGGTTENPGTFTGGGGVGHRQVAFTIAVRAEGSDTKPLAPILSEDHGDDWVQLGTTGFQPHPSDPTDTHQSTDWQVTTAADTGFATPVVNVNSTTALLAYLSEGTLSGSTACIARARHNGELFNGDWSNVASFTTDAAIPKGDQPTLSPVDEGVDYIEVSISAFNHSLGEVPPEDFDPENPKPYLAYSQFQIRLSSDPDWTTPLAQIDVPYIGGDLNARFTGLTASTSYKLRGRQLDGYLSAYTLWSSDLTRSTDATPTDNPLQPTLTVVSCGRDIVLTGSVYAHSTVGAGTAHASTEWAICVSGQCQSIVTSEASQLLAWTWQDVPPAAYTLKVRYIDSAGRAGPYSSTQPCSVSDYAPVPVFLNPALGAVIATSQTITWEAYDPNAIGWRFDIQLSTNGGSSWTTVATNQVAASTVFTITGRPNGEYLFRVRARHPSTGEVGEWAYMPITIDRTGTRAIHYHFADFSEFLPTWRQVWEPEPRVTWNLRETYDPDEDVTYRVGLMARAPLGGSQTRTSGLVFDEWGEPDEFDLTVAFEHIPKECTWYPYRFANMFVTRGGSIMFARDEPDTSGHISLMQWSAHGGWYLGPEMACVNDNFKNHAAAFTAKYAMRSDNLTESFRYGRSLTAGKLVTITAREGTGTSSQTSTATTSTTSPRSGGPYVYTDEDLVLGRNRMIFVMRHTVRRAVVNAQTGWNITTRLFGPGADLTATHFVAETNTSGFDVVCGACGLGFSDMDQIGVGRSEGILFTDVTFRPVNYAACETPAEELIGCQADWDFTVFEDDDITPWYGTADSEGNVGEADFYDSLSCPRPYLMPPTDFSETEIDYPAGASTIGGIKVGVLDKRLTTDQGSGIVTAKIANAVGRRAVLRRWRDDLGMVTVFDGIIESWEVDSDSIVTYWFNLRDPRERERKTELFLKNETFALYPDDGPIEAYGATGSQEAGFTYLLSPVQPQTAAEFSRLSDPGGDNGVHWGLAVLSERDDQFKEEVLRPFGFSVYDGITNYYRFQDITVRWRLSTGGQWVYLRNMPSVAPSPGAALVDNAIVPPGEEGGVWLLYMSSHVAAEIPNDGSLIDLQILAARTTPASPFFWDRGTFGDLLLEIYDGEHSNFPPSIRFNRERLEQWALETPRARFILTEPVPDMREWVQENIFAPIGWAPTFDEDMRIIPSLWELPSNDQELVELDPDWIIPVGDLSYDTASIINRVKYTYIKETLLAVDIPMFRIPVFGPAIQKVVTYLSSQLGSTWLRLAQETVLRDYIFSDSQFLGEHMIDYKPVTVRSTGGLNEALMGLLSGVDTADRIADRVAHNVLFRFGWGACEFYAGVRSGMAHGPGFDPYTLDLEVGQWVKCRVPYLPEFSTGTRQLYRYMQIKSITDPEIHYRRLRLVDGGPVVEESLVSGGDGYETVPPLDPPAIDYLGETTDLRVEVPITFPPNAPSGYRVRVDFAVSLSEPNAASGLWTLAGYLTAEGSVFTAVLPAGVTVWVRARGEVTGRLPSAWTPSETITLSQTPGLLSLTAALIENSGTAQITWTPNDYAEGLRIEVSTGAIGHTPAYGAYDDVDADAPLTLNLTGEEIDYGEEIYIRVTAYPGFSGGNVTGSAGLQYVRRVTRVAPHTEATHSLGDHDDTDFIAPESRSEGMVPSWDPYDMLFHLEEVPTLPLDLTTDVEGVLPQANGGVKPGGTTGQVYKKQSNADFDADWEDDETGGAGSLDFWEPMAPPASAGSEDDEFSTPGAGVPSGWTEIDHGTNTTVAVEDYGLVLTQTTHAGASWAGIYKSIPAGDFTIWTKVFLQDHRAVANMFVGLALFEDATSATADIDIISLITSGTTFGQVQHDRYAAYNGAVTTTRGTLNVGPSLIDGVYFRLRRTGTTYAADWSTNGLTWVNLTNGVALGYTATHFGLVINNGNTGSTMSTIHSFFRYVASDVGRSGVVGGARL